MKNRISEFIKSILAGMMISIGGMIYLASANKYIGALLFTVGLISVVFFGFNLYTGKIGYVLQNDKVFLVDTLLSVVGNLIGCIVMGLIKMPISNVVEVCENKLQKGIGQTFIDGILCGILVYISVEIFKKRDAFIGILVCIPTFILAGFEHSIADMFYFVNARIFTAQALLFIVIVVLGNSVGGLLIPILKRISDRLKA